MQIWLAQSREVCRGRRDRSEAVCRRCHPSLEVDRGGDHGGCDHGGRGQLPCAPVYEARARVVIVKSKSEITFEPRYRTLTDEEWARAGKDVASRRRSKFFSKARLLHCLRTLEIVKVG